MVLCFYASLILGSLTKRITIRHTVIPANIVKANGYIGFKLYRNPARIDAGTVARMFSVPMVPIILPLFSFGIMSACNA